MRMPSFLPILKKMCATFHLLGDDEIPQTEERNRSERRERERSERCQRCREGSGRPPREGTHTHIRYSHANHTNAMHTHAKHTQGIHTKHTHTRSLYFLFQSQILSFLSLTHLPPPQPEDEEDIKYVEEKDGLSLKAASLEKLLRVRSLSLSLSLSFLVFVVIFITLTFPQFVISERASRTFRKHFLLTYRFFTDSVTLLTNFSSLYMHSAADNEKNVCANVTEIIKMWIIDHPPDFEEEKTRENLLLFCCQIEKVDGYQSHAAFLRGAVAKKPSRVPPLVRSDITPNPSSPPFPFDDPLSWSDDDTRKLADQITFWTMESFLRVTSQEVIYYVKVITV